MSRNRSRKNRGGEAGGQKDSSRSAFFDAAYEWKTDHTATRNQSIEADETSGGISNRELGRERSEQERVPERGRSKDEEPDDLSADSPYDRE